MGLKMQSWGLCVGYMVGSCRTCVRCTNNLENYCPKMILKYGSAYLDGSTMYGGFVICWTESLPLDYGAPLLCASVTTYCPLKYFGVNKPEMHSGVVGLGGLGHVNVKFANAFGAKVTVISTSPSKQQTERSH